MKRVLYLFVSATVLAGATWAKADNCIFVIDHVQTVCYTGVFPQSPVVVGIGNGVVNLPATTFTNNSSVEIKFLIQWTSATLAGGGAIGSEVDIPANGGTVNVGSPSFQINTTGVNVGIYDIDMSWSAVSVGSSTVQVNVVQPLEVDVVLPDQVREILQVPVRFCAIEGTRQAEGLPAGSIASGAKLFSLMRQVNDNIWLPQASIIFRPVGGLLGVPVIPYPPYPGFPPGSVSQADPMATTVCESAWQMLAPDQQGIIVVNAGIIISDLILGSGGTIGGTTPGPAPTLWVSPIEPGSGGRPNDLCGFPRNLSVSDVTPENRVIVYDQALYNDPITDQYQGSLPGAFDPVHVLGHELGHSLMLGHGNGLDDNMDGLLPPTPGIRRYDMYCDRLEDAGEDVLTSVTTPCNDSEESSDTQSLMTSPATSCENLHPLQREQARDVAKLVPGILITDPTLDPAGQLIAAPGPCPPTCSVPPELVIEKVEISETPAKATTAFAFTVPQLPTNASDAYVVYADLDNDSQTGCGSPLPGAPTGLEGAELAAQVQLDTSGGTQTATPTVWTCNSGSWTEVSNPGISAAAYAQPIINEAGGTKTGIGLAIVSIEMPDSVHAPMGSVVRLQAVSQAQAGGQTDLLPSSGGGGAVSLTPPALLTCTVSPPLAAPGSPVSVSATSLPASTAADFYLGARKMATAKTDVNGQVTANITIPATINSGAVEAVEIQAQGSSANSACGVLIQGAAATPATTATLTPPPNSNGWNKTAVAVGLTAVDVSGGPGIKQLTYSSSGAQTIPSTTQLGASANFTVNAQGMTTVQFFATDNGSLSEAPQMIPVNIDETPPAVTYSGDQGMYGILDTINISCSASDALSGLVSSTCKNIAGLGYTFTPGPNTFTAKASDYAGNVGQGSTTFTIRVTSADLCSLTDQFIVSSAHPNISLGNSLCAQLTAAQRAPNLKAKQGAITAYVNDVNAVTPLVFSSNEASILTSLAHAL